MSFIIKTLTMSSIENCC